MFTWVGARCLAVEAKPFKPIVILESNHKQNGLALWVKILGRLLKSEAQTQSTKEIAGQRDVQARPRFPIIYILIFHLNALKSNKSARDIIIDKVRLTASSEFARTYRVFLFLVFLGVHENELEGLNKWADCLNMLHVSDSTHPVDLSVKWRNAKFH